MAAILIAMSAYFSASETALSSASRVRIKSMAENGNKKALRALYLIDNYDKTLSTILIGNNIVNIAVASIMTYIATKIFGPGGVGISTAVTTVFVLIFGEILPKSSAKENADEFSMTFSSTLKFLVFVLTPLSAIFSGIKGAMKRNDDDEKKPSITEEELKYIIEEVHDEGVLEKQESELAQSALEFDEIKVGEILTPRVDVTSIDIDTPYEEILQTLVEGCHSRVPVYEDTIDNIIGVLHKQDFLSECAYGIQPDIRKIMNKPIFVPDNIKISHALSKMQKGKNQLAVVTDQHGGTVGIITVEDILEELVGEIWDEHDEIIQPIIPLSPNVYKVDAGADLCDFLEEIGYDGDEIESRYNSVGGWVCEVMEKIPQKGEQFEANGLKVTVDEADEKQVESVTIEYIIE